MVDGLRAIKVLGVAAFWFFLVKGFDFGIDTLHGRPDRYFALILHTNNIKICGMPGHDEGSGKMNTFCLQRIKDESRNVVRYVQRSPLSLGRIMHGMDLRKPPEFAGCRTC